MWHGDKKAEGRRQRGKGRKEKKGEKGEPIFFFLFLSPFFSH